jgi:hypothetical protein
MHGDAVAHGFIDCFEVLVFSFPVIGLVGWKDHKSQFLIGLTSVQSTVGVKYLVSFYTD